MKNTQNIKLQIQEKLREIENQYNVTVISCRDTGSRAWNLHSEKSDYDPSFIYIQPYQDYILPKHYDRNIDRKYKDLNIDMNSWNLKRFLNLYYKSNPAAINYVLSNKTYYEPYPKYIDKLETHARTNFKPLALMQHYHNLAKNQYERHISTQKKPTVKKYLYVTRALTYKKYIEEHLSLPPLNYPTFWKTSKQKLGSWSNYDTQITNLINQKKHGEGANHVNNKHFRRKLEKALDKKLTDDEKQHYATYQQINRDFITKTTTNFIKANIQNDQTWIQKLKKNLKKLFLSLSK